MAKQKTTNLGLAEMLSTPGYGVLLPEYQEDLLATTQPEVSKKLSVKASGLDKKKPSLEDVLSAPQQDAFSLPQRKKADTDRLMALIEQMGALESGVQTQSLADKLANTQMQQASLEAYKPQVDLRNAMAFFSDWTGNKSGLEAYKSPKQVQEVLAANQKLFPTSTEDADKLRLDAIKAQLDSVFKQEDMKNKGDSLASLLQKLSIEEKLLSRKEKEQKKEVPGYERLYGTIPTDKDVETLKNVQAKYSQASKGLKDLERLVQENGIEIIPGPTKTQMESIYSDLKIQLKELANLGALTGPDVAILEQQLKDPTSILSIGQGGSALKSIKQTLDNVRQKVASESVARGYEPKFLEKEIETELKKEQNKIPRTEAIASPSKPKTVIQNGHTYRLNESTGEYE